MRFDHEDTVNYDDFDKVRLGDEESKEGLFSPFTFFCISLLLTLSGLFFLYSASYDTALRIGQKHYYFFILELSGLCLGLFFGFALFFVPNRYFEKAWCFLCPISYILLILSLFPRFNINGYFSIESFQLLSPAFLAAISSISLLSSTVSSIMKQKKEMRGVSYLSIFLTVLGFAILSSFTSGIVWFFIIVLSSSLILYSSGATKSITLILLAFGLITGFFVFAFNTEMVNSFVNSLFISSNPVLYDHNLFSSELAIREGSIFGRGIGKGFYKLGALDSVHTEFVFSSFAEETGIIGIILLIILFLLFTLLGVRTSSRAIKKNNRFIASSTLGLICLISLISVFNMLYCSGLLPLKGTFLPFFSYSIGNEAVLITILFVLYKYIFAMGRDNESKS